MIFINKMVCETPILWYYLGMFSRSRPTHYVRRLRVAIEKLGYRHWFEVKAASWFTKGLYFDAIVKMPWGLLAVDLYGAYPNRFGNSSPPRVYEVNLELEKIAVCRRHGIPLLRFTRMVSLDDMMIRLLECESAPPR